jgi:hypothetical protein
VCSITNARQPERLFQADGADYARGASLAFHASQVKPAQKTGAHQTKSSQIKLSKGQNVFSLSIAHIRTV